MQTRDQSLAPLIALLLDEYAWFLSAVGREKKVVLEWISHEDTRIDAFAHGTRFVESMGDLVRIIAEKNGYLRYLIV